MLVMVKILVVIMLVIGRMMVVVNTSSVSMIKVIKILFGELKNSKQSGSQKSQKALMFWLLMVCQ